MKKRKQKRSFFRRKRVFLLILLVLTAAMFIRSEWIEKLIYPVSYKEEIRINAQRYGQDPYLIAAIIRVESNYDEKAVSRKGAVGIMQVMPETARWILEQERFGGLTVEDAGSRAEAGIRLGAWYLRELNRQFGGSVPLMLAAYNAGPNKVRQWLSDRIWDGTEASLQDIPYGETRQYVRRVMYYYKKYKEIYDSF